MAQKSNRSSSFTLLAVALAVLLLMAAATSYLQSRSPGGLSGGEAEYAVLSQAIPLHAGAALAGDADGFTELQADLQKLSRLSFIKVRHPEWQVLHDAGQAILQQQQAVGDAAAAVQVINDGAPRVLETSNELFSVSGDSEVLFEFQHRLERFSVRARSLLGSDNADELASALIEDFQYLLAVTAALAGEQSDSNVAALSDAARDSILLPVRDALTGIEASVYAISESAAAVASSRASLDELREAAAASLRASLSGTAGRLPSFLMHPYLAPGLLALALLVLLGLFVVYSRVAVFEKASAAQAQQNEKNQRAILRLLDELGSLADGDLTVEATVTEDITGAIADSINYAIEKLRELVLTINETSIMVDSAAKQTKSSAAHMERAAENQSREIAATADSMVSMAASIEEVSGNAERSSDVARHSVDVAHKGGEAVRRTIDGMNTIRETIQETSKRIKRLGESSQEIGNIVELINDIAEQTNILALNASIQASMAGEAGRGFAVVADEVQRLAERSTNATRQIEVLVRTIQADTNEAVVSMERSTTDVVGGALLAENAGAALDEIEQVSNQIASLVQNISGSAREQAGAAADVTRRTTLLKEITEETRKATAATAASISKLSELASQLRNTVDGFTLPTQDGSETLPSLRIGFNRKRREKDANQDIND